MADIEDWGRVEAGGGFLTVSADFFFSNNDISAADFQKYRI